VPVTSRENNNGAMGSPVLRIEVFTNLTQDGALHEQDQHWRASGFSIICVVRRTERIDTLSRSVARST
jgi:hypothetical protein